jgi:hypothetical protein
MARCVLLIGWVLLVATGCNTGERLISLRDANENVKYGEVSDYQTVYAKPEFHVENRIMNCQLSESKCKSVDEFNNLARPYMNN